MLVKHNYPPYETLKHSYRKPIGFAGIILQESMAWLHWFCAIVTTEPGT